MDVGWARSTLRSSLGSSHEGSASWPSLPRASGAEATARRRRTFRSASPLPAAPGARPGCCAWPTPTSRLPLRGVRRPDCRRFSADLCRERAMDQPQDRCPRPLARDRGIPFKEAVIRTIRASRVLRLALGEPVQAIAARPPLLRRAVPPRGDAHARRRQAAAQLRAPDRGLQGRLDDARLQGGAPSPRSAPRWATAG